MDPTGGILTGAGSILGALPSIFGTTTTTSQRSGLEFRPEDLARMEAGASQYQGGVSDLLKQLQGFQSQLQTQMPTAPGQFQYTGGFDPITRGLAASGREDILRAAAASRANLSPEMRGALGNQINIQSALQSNPLMAQYGQQQFARQLSQAQMQQQQYGDLVRNLLGQTQLGANLATTGLGAQANLAQYLTDLATRKATTTSTTTQEGGGFL